MEDQRRKAYALSSMSLEVVIKIWQDPILVCAEDAESNCRCFSNHGIMMDGPKEDEARPIVLE